MAIIVKGNKGTSFTPHPEGQYAARCIDVVDLGWMPGSQTYPDPKYKIRLVFYCGLRTEEKEVEGVKKTFPALVMSTFTASLGDKANLRDFCRRWKGKDFTPEVIRDGFDFELMVGAAAYLQIEHNVKGDNTYANIGSVMKLGQDQADAPDAPDDYIRVCKREGWPGPNPHPAMSEPDQPEAPASFPDDDDSDLPF